jgi:hypothetical protein
LVFIYAIGFVIRLCLIFLIDVQTSDTIKLKFNRAESNTPRKKRAAHDSAASSFLNIKIILLVMDGAPADYQFLYLILKYFCDH